MTIRIYLSPPDVGSLERRMLLEAFDSGWIAPVGPSVDAFECDVARLVGTSSAAALSSGTGGLHLVLVALGVGAGDEVVVPTMTFAATANVVRYVGAQPVFLDISEATWTLDPELLHEFLTDRARRGCLPRAVISVDLYGQCCDYESIERSCDQFGVPLVCDAAEALGADYRGRSAGSFGVAGVFSFNGNKIITCSGGGMVVSNDEELVRRVVHLATQAREPAAHYEHVEVGYNYRLSNLLAALGRAQLQSLAVKIEARRLNRECYAELLSQSEGISLMPVADYGEPNYWLTCARFAVGSGFTPEKVRLRLQDAGIEARPVWKPMHLQRAFESSHSSLTGVADRIFAEGLCLPSGSALDRSEIEEVCDLILASR